MYIAIVDDNPALANSLAEKLKLFEDFHVSFIAHNGKDAVEKLAATPEHTFPKVVLMDLEMPVMDGITACTVIKEKYPDVKLLVLTVFDNDEKIFKATMAGASGYFLKDEKITRIVEGIDELINGGAPMSSLVAAKTLELLRNSGNTPASAHSKPADFSLSTREVEILQHLSAGLSNKQIGDICFISPSTVKKHVENIYHKLHISSRAEAVKIAMTNKWL